VVCSQRGLYSKWDDTASLITMLATSCFCTLIGFQAAFMLVALNIRLSSAGMSALDECPSIPELSFDKDVVWNQRHACLTQGFTKLLPKQAFFT